MSAGRQAWQPSGVFHASSCRTAGWLLSPRALISRRTSSWVRSVHRHIGFSALISKPSPRLTASTCSTSPVQVPQEADAFVVARTSSSECAPASMALTISPLQTPLQPQISASGANAATAARGSAAAVPPPWKAGPKISVSRIRSMAVPSLISPKNQLPSAVSPYITAPTSRSFSITRRL